MLVSRTDKGASGDRRLEAGASGEMDQTGIGLYFGVSLLQPLKTRHYNGLTWMHCIPPKYPVLWQTSRKFLGTTIHGLVRIFIL